MKKIFYVLIIALIALSACNKKRGVCYCKYYSGDKTHYDLRELPRQEQKDSCAVLNNLASNFAGDCKLK